MTFCSVSTFLGTNRGLSSTVSVTVCSSVSTFSAICGSVPQFKAQLVKFSTVQLQSVTVFPQLHRSVSMGSVENCDSVIMSTAITLPVCHFA